MEVDDLMKMRGSANDKRNCGSKVILLADDMKSLEEIIETLSPAGYDLSCSIAGHNISEFIHKKGYDLVLVDLMAEGINGFDIIKMIKSSHLNSNTPILFITDREKKKNLMAGLHVTGIDFIKSPFTREELLTRINNQIMWMKANQKLIESRLISESIRSALRIQKALIPPECTLNESFNNYFLINLPKDVVSGDFYWFRKIENQILLAVGDCTGHGVPGALLSMLGISLLNEICTKKNPGGTSEILEILRSKLKNSLLQAKGHSPLADGMDISLISINPEMNTLEFSGAYQRIIISRNDKIFEFKGDSQPIGFHPINLAFSHHRFDLQKGDQIYLTTDGYSDQFGGEKGKKLQLRNFTQLIRKFSDYPLQMQKNLLLEEHRKWKGINDQVDDILVMGLQY
jgi:serine phosphatase RsbU (regulator of sigma subunit)